MTPELSLLYTHAGIMGYGRAGTELHRALSAQGMRVYDAFANPGKSFDDMPWAGKQEGQTNVCCWVTFPSHARGWFKEQMTVIFTMFETDALPEAFRESLDQFDKVLVPSWNNVELFSRYHDNVTFVPLGVDPVAWGYVPRKPDRFFTYLCAGSGERKGSDLAVRAFRKVFPRPLECDPIPRLILKSPRPDDEINGVMLAGRNIEMVSGRMSPEAEIDLYASAHCMIAPSRGEGFGLQPLQAMAQGCPTILTNAHGHESFAHLGIPIGSSMAPSGYFDLAGEGRAGQWWEPNFDDLCEAMLDVYQRYDHYRGRAEEAAEIIAADWTWDASATKFRHAIGEENFSLPYRGNGEWYAPELRRYRVITKRNFVADITGGTFIWEAGKTYWEVADVKRTLYDGGILDPECLDDGEGLNQQQVDALGEYSGQHGYCPTCHQKLGSGVTKSDEIYESLVNAHDHMQ